MIRSFSLTAVLAATSVVGGISSAGTWTSAGGGTGVACFRTPEEGQRARRLATPLPDDLAQDIVSLFTTEVWENPRATYVEPQWRLDRRDYEDPSTYIDRILAAYLTTTAPSLRTKLNDALTRVSLDHGLAGQGPLKPIHDTGPIVQWQADDPNTGRRQIRAIILPPECAPVQIVVRQARGKAPGLVATAVYLDPRLYNKLGMNHGHIDRRDQILNQAALKLHEALYLMGYELGQSSSEKVRHLTSLLLSVDKFNAFIQKATQAMIDHPNAPYWIATYVIDELYSDGFGQFPFIDSRPASRRLQNLRKAYDLYERTHVANTPNQQFIVATILARTQSLIPDFYALLNNDRTSASVTAAVCDFVGYEYQKLIGGGKIDDRAETPAVLTGARSYCQNLSRVDD